MEFYMANIINILFMVTKKCKLSIFNEKLINNNFNNNTNNRINIYNNIRIINKLINNIKKNM